MFHPRLDSQRYTHGENINRILEAQGKIVFLTEILRKSLRAQSTSLQLRSPQLKFGRIYLYEGSKAEDFMLSTAAHPERLSALANPASILFHSRPMFIFPSPQFSELPRIFEIKETARFAVALEHLYIYIYINHFSQALRSPKGNPTMMIPCLRGSSIVHESDGLSRATTSSTEGMGQRRGSTMRGLRSHGQGPNALALQEPCFGCENIMPGLCYPIARRNTGESERCHACLIDVGIFWRVSHSQLSSSSINNATIADAALLMAFSIPPDTYLYIKAPMNVNLNTVCPFRLSREKKCKHEYCNLRAAFILN